MQAPTGLLTIALLAGAALSAACAKESAKTQPSMPTLPDTVTAEEPAAAPAAPEVGQQPRLVAEGQGYRVEVKPPEACALGTETKAEVVLTPTDGYKVNKEFPTSLAVGASDGVTVKTATQTPAEAATFEEKGATFDVAFTCTSAGAKDFGATFKFAVCTETTCDPKREKLAWAVTAAPE